METIAELLEKLIIINIRLWNLQNVVASEKDDSKCAEAARAVVEVNKQRALLKNAINKYFGISVEEIKKYGE